jgi:hypothetical protein
MRIITTIRNRCVDIEDIYGGREKVLREDCKDSKDERWSKGDVE